MKKFILAIFIAIILTGSGYSQVALSTKDSLTSLQDIDLMLWQRKVTGTYLNRQMSYNNFKLTLKDYLDGQAITWAGKQTFSAGATFSAAGTGVVTFADSVWHASGAHYVNRIYPTTAATSQIGTLVSPYENIWSKNFKIANSGGTDSASITVDTDGNVNISKLKITEEIHVDSAATMRVLAFTAHSYTIPNVGDTILTLVAANRYSMIELDLPGNLTTGISRIYVEGAQKGFVLRLYNMDASYACKFNDYVGNDDNLYLSAGFDFGQYDYLELMCVVESIIGQTWIETGRSNN